MQGETNFISSPDDKNYQLKADLPGLNKEDITAKTVNGMLYVSATKGEEGDPSFYYLSRSFRLPQESNVDEISASYDKKEGLKLSIPKLSNTKKSSTQLNQQESEVKTAFNDDKVRKIEVQ